MTFRETLVYLDSFVNYERQPAYPYARSLKLERMRMFLSSIGNPQGAFKSIHVAGTKGKGSVCVFCAHILRAAGLRVGLYTSPHLNDVRERIRILDRRPRPGDFEGMIPREELASLVSRLRPAIDSFCSSSPFGPLSFFEIYTALAFAYFKQRRVECAVLETGLGGRLDATNVVLPAACGITSISLDHTQKLGRTLARIAREKAGIIKSCAAGVVSAPQRRSVRDVLARKCGGGRVRLHLVGRDILICGLRRRGATQYFDLHGRLGEYRGLAIRLPGSHQAVNAACAAGLALCAAKALGRPVTAESIRGGLAASVWPGRFEIVRKRFVLDGAHNGESARMLAKTLREFFPGKRITVILGVSKDKNLSAICRGLGGVSRRFIATAASNPRAFSCRRVAVCLGAQAPGARISSSPDIARALARTAAGGDDDVYCVTGSLFLVGEARALLRRKTYA